MIGQEKIIDYIENKTRDTFPRSLILLGEKGCGKHTVTEIIADRLNLQVVDITDNLNFDYLLNLQQKPEPFIYLIRAVDTTIKAQNAMLKFVEEPLKNSFIVIIAENSNQLLPTVYNRCQVLNFKPYSKEELKNFTNNDFIIEVAKTPGQVKLLESSNIDDLVVLCNKIVTKIGVANVPNVLTIPNKIAFKQEKDKFDLDILSIILGYSITKYIKENNVDKKYYEFYDLYRNWDRERRATTLNQKVLFENYLLKCKDCLGA